MASSEEEEAPHRQVQKFVDSTLLLQSGLARYFNQQLFTDITVVAPDERKILCHQVVLSAGSQRFANMLEQGNLHGEELPVWGVDSDSLEAIIRFFYSGECLLRYPDAIGVLDAAIRLDVPVLAAAADSYIRGCMHSATVTTILSQSAQYKINNLVSACLDFASNNFEAVVATSDFAAGSFQAISKILGQVADSQPELTLFKAAWCWIVSDIRHVNHLEALLKVVKVPPISLTELVQLGQLGNSSPTAAAAAVAAAAGEVAPGETPSFSQLQAAAMQIGKPPVISNDPAGASAGEAEQGHQQVARWQGVTVTTSSPTKAAAGNRSPASAARLADPNAHSTAEALAAAAAVTDEGNLLAALTGGSLMSPTGSSLPGGTLNPALTGGYDSSAMPTPSSRGPLELMMGHDRAAAAAMGMPHAGRFSSSEVQDYAAAAAAAAAAFASGMHGGMGHMGEGMYGDGSADPQHMAARYNSSSYEEAAMAGGTSSGGRSVSPGAGGRVWTRSARGDGSAAMAVAAAAASVGRSSHAKGVCQVEGCYADLKGLRDYHLRYKICEYHLKVSSIIRDGKPQRFCQQCGRFHLLTDFDGNKRSCRARLQRHNARRRKRGEDDVTTYTPSSKRGRGMSSGQIGDEMMDMTGRNGAAGDPSAWGAAGMANGMDGASMAAYMAAMGGQMGGPGGFNPAGYPGAFPGAAADGSMQGHYLGQFGGQYGAMGPMPGVDPAAAAAAAVGEGEMAGMPGRSGGYGSRRSSARGSRPASALGNRKEGRHDESGEGEQHEQGHQQEDMRGWAAGLEMLADVAQLGNDNQGAAAGDGAAAAAAANGGSAPAAAAAPTQAATAEGAIEQKPQVPQEGLSEQDPAAAAAAPVAEPAVDPAVAAAAAAPAEALAAITPEAAVAQHTDAAVAPVAELAAVQSLDIVAAPVSEPAAVQPLAAVVKQEAPEQFQRPAEAQQAALAAPIQQTEQLQQHLQEPQTQQFVDLQQQQQQQLPQQQAIEQQQQPPADQQPAVDGACPPTGAVSRPSTSPVATPGSLFAGRSSPPHDAHPKSAESAEAASAGKEGSAAAPQLSNRCDDQTTGTAAGAAAPAVC